MTDQRLDLPAILAAHGKWLRNEAGGSRADLRRAELRGADLSSADLRGADLRGADLRSADLRSAVLRSADLSSADLSSAVLRRADLSSADLRSAVLRRADLRRADLRSADLRRADLSSAVLSSADLSSADLRSADLRSADLSSAVLSSADLSSADLRGADLSSADLSGVKGADLAIARTRILSDGEIIGWKAAREPASGNRCIVKLLIPADAQRSHAFGRKCRASKATVLEIIGAAEAHSEHDHSFIYRVSETVTPSGPFNPDWTEECASGIHFYITRIEAENH